MKKISLFLLMTFACSLGVVQASSNGQTNSKTNQFVWNELATKDLQKAKDFYGKVFGWTFLEKKTDNNIYTLIKVNGQDIGGIWSIPKDRQNEIAPHWLAFILVDNIDEALAKATKNGATIVKSVTTAGEWGKLAIFKDPTGAEIAIWQALKQG